MSALEIYRINGDGIVKPFGNVRNASAGGWFIWDELSKHLCGVPCNLHQQGDIQVWKKFHDKSVDRNWRICLGFTFDAVWIAKKNIPETCTALTEFWKRFGSERVVNTIPKAVEVMTFLHGEPGRGVCFNITSVNSNPWRFYNGLTDESREFDFNVDAKDDNGNTAWELFEGMDK